MKTKQVGIIGGGPAGLMAAEVLSSCGHSVTVYDSMPTVSRKFLLAGKSGLNITHAEDYARFVQRFGPAAQRLRPALDAFTPDDVRNWATGLGTETFIGSSGRVFPRVMKASPLLRAWLGRLEGRGVKLLVQEYARQLDEVENQLAARIAGDKPPPLHNGQVGRGVLALQRQLAFASLGNTERTKARAAAVSRLHAAAGQLARQAPFALSQEERARMLSIRQACASLRECLGHDAPFVPMMTPPAVAGSHGAILREMERALRAAADADNTDGAGATSVAAGPAAAASPHRHLVYAQFAFKTVLAAMITYIIYTGLQWPGIGTAMQTCIILALPSLGATTHKGINRLLGCCLGSLAALVATVFVVPHLDSVVGLLAMSLPIIAVGAWIAVGSPRSNYIGVQMMFAFALAQLGGFGPVTDLTEIRDRLVGILLGLAVSVTVYTLVWPEREGQALKSALSRLRKAVAACAHADHHELGAARLHAWALLNQCRELHARVALEPGWRGRNSRRIANLLAQAEEKLAMQQARH